MHYFLHCVSASISLIPLKKNNYVLSRYSFRYRNHRSPLLILWKWSQHRIHPCPDVQEQFSLPWKAPVYVLSLKTVGQSCTRPFFWILHFSNKLMHSSLGDFLDTSVALSHILLIVANRVVVYRFVRYCHVEKCHNEQKHAQVHRHSSYYDHEEVRCQRVIHAKVLPLLKPLYSN